MAAPNGLSSADNEARAFKPVQSNSQEEQQNGAEHSGNGHPDSARQANGHHRHPNGASIPAAQAILNQSPPAPAEASPPPAPPSNNQGGWMSRWIFQPIKSTASVIAHPIATAQNAAAAMAPYVPNAIAHPIQTAQNAGTALLHPVATAHAAVNAAAPYVPQRIINAGAAVAPYVPHAIAHPLEAAQNAGNALLHPVATAHAAINAAAPYVPQAVKDASYASAQVVKDVTYASAQAAKERAVEVGGAVGEHTKIVWFTNSCKNSLQANQQIINSRLSDPEAFEETATVLIDYVAAFLGKNRDELEKLKIPKAILTDVDRDLYRSLILKLFVLCVPPAGEKITSEQLFARGVSHLFNSILALYENIDRDIHIQENGGYWLINPKLYNSIWKLSSLCSFLTEDRNWRLGIRLGAYGL